MLPTLQEMVDIASRFDTLIAHVVIRACVVRALETGEPLRLPDRPQQRDPDPFVIVVDGDGHHRRWRRLMESNTDTRWMHM